MQFSLYNDNCPIIHYVVLFTVIMFLLQQGVVPGSGCCFTKGYNSLSS